MNVFTRFYSVIKARIRQERIQTKRQNEEFERAMHRFDSAVNGLIRSGPVRHDHHIK